MVERRPTLGVLAHVVLLLGVLVVAFPVYVALVASTHTAEEIVQMNHLCGASQSCFEQST